MILVGTNGFQYRDWVPAFYPPSLQASGWLEFYGRHFDCCELNLAYYKVPEPAAVQALVHGSRGRIRFVFRIPFRLLEDHPENTELADRFCGAIWPLRESGQLDGVLAQFGEPFGFIRDHFDRLCRLRDSLRGIPLIAEFASADWRTERAARHLRKACIALAVVDGGRGDGDRPYFCGTADVGYVRFQGRNHSRWIPGESSRQHDYLYSRAELAEMLPALYRLESEVERVLVVLNNPWRARAAINALMLKELLAR